VSQALESAPWTREAERFLEGHGLEATVSVAELGNLLASQTASWRAPLPDGRGLYFLKLRVPLTEREEVLAGNLLFSDFVRKCALESLKLEGEALALTGDLDDAYYLVVSGKKADALARSVRENVGQNLADLFFGADDPERGIHGSPENMFGFTKCDFEPYPVFAVPSFLSSDLYQSMVGVLERKVAEEPLIPRTGVRRASLALRNIQATLAFFFGRTSGGSGDAQSPANFLFRLVGVYGVLDEKEVRAALRLTEFSKGAIKDSFDKATLDKEKTRELLQKLIHKLKNEKAEDGDPENSWFLPNIRRTDKLLQALPEEYLDSILDGASLGFTPLGEAERGDGLVCRVCGARVGPVGEKNILLGISVGKFHNQSGSIEKGARICARCALFSFLSIKLFGMTSAGKFPVPSKENLIFHYGRHSEEDVKRLENMANEIIGLLQEFREVRRAALEANKQREEDERVSLDARWSAVKLRELVASREGFDTELVGDLLEQFYLDTPLVEQVVSTVRKINVFSLGAEEQKIVIFALPHFRDELELAHRRFSKNRSTVFSLMAFLSELCGCNGPFFFQGKPRLEDSGNSGVFYIRDRPYASERYRRRYEALSKFAYNAVGGKLSDALKDRLKLAIELEDAPLATFDSVLKASPIRAGQKADEGRYRRLSNKDGKAEYDRRLGVYSPWEYLKFFDGLRQLEKEERLG
jgi:hypothetical protein